MSDQYWRSGYRQGFDIGFVIATTLFQDGVAGDQTTGESSPSLSSTTCFERMEAGISCFLDHGGAVAITSANTWQYTARAINTNTVIACVWPYEEAPPDPYTIFVLEVSPDAETWYAVDSYTTTSTSFFTRSGTFASAVVLPPFIRYVRLSGQYVYYRLGLVSQVAVRVTDLRDNISDYTPPTVPPPRGNTTTGKQISTRGNTSQRCVVAQGTATRRQIS